MQDCHDRTDKLLSPFDLKTFSLFTPQGYNPDVAKAFVNHLALHILGKVSYKCKKCSLVFVEPKDLKHHADKEHCTFKGVASKNLFQISEHHHHISH